MCDVEFRAENLKLCGNKLGISGSCHYIKPWRVGARYESSLVFRHRSSWEEKCWLAFVHAETWKCGEETLVGNSWMFNDCCRILSRQLCSAFYKGIDVLLSSTCSLPTYHFLKVFCALQIWMSLSGICRWSLVYVAVYKLYYFSKKIWRVHFI